MVPDQVRRHHSLLSQESLNHRLMSRCFSLVTSFQIERSAENAQHRPVRRPDPADVHGFLHPEGIAVTFPIFLGGREGWCPYWI